MNSSSLLLKLFPVLQVIYLEITFRGYEYPSFVIYFLKVLVLNSFTGDSPIRPSLTKRLSHSSHDNILTRAYRQQNLLDWARLIPRSPFWFFSCCIHCSGQEQFFLLLRHLITHRSRWRGHTVVFPSSMSKQPWKQNVWYAFTGSLG